MKLSTHLILQALLLVAQGANLLSGLVSVKYQPLVAVGVAALQGVAGWIAHNYNPDGTPAQAAWNPDKK